jgi:hypothetical protein
LAYIGNRILDEGLNKFNAEATHIHVCSAEPASFAEVSSLSLGNKASPEISVSEDRENGGRQVRISAITDGSITSTGTISHFAIIDNNNSRLLATGSLDSAKSVVIGDTWTWEELTIGIPGAIE